MIEPKNIEPCFNCGIIDRYCQKKITEELENIWEKIRALPDINPDYPVDRQIHISRYEVQNIIYDRLSELKGEITNSKGVLEQIAEEQKTLLDTTKAWSKALEHGDIY